MRSVIRSLIANTPDREGSSRADSALRRARPIPTTNGSWPHLAFHELSLGDRDLKDVIISELNGGSGVINFPDHSNEHGIDVNRVTPLLEST